MPKLRPDELDTHGIDASSQDQRKLKKWMGWNWEPAKRDATPSDGPGPSISNEKRKTLVFLIVILSFVMLLIGLNVASVL